MRLQIIQYDEIFVVAKIVDLIQNRLLKQLIHYRI